MDPAVSVYGNDDGKSISDISESMGMLWMNFQNKFLELAKYEAKLKERERQLDEREKHLEIMMNKFTGVYVKERPENYQQDAMVKNTPIENIYTVSSFDPSFTSNKLQLQNNNTSVTKKYNDEWTCACMGVVDGNFENLDCIRFKIKLGNNCNGLFVGFANQDDFYLSGKNYTTCAWMIQLILTENKLQVLKYSPDHEGSKECQLLVHTNNLFGLCVEMIYHKVKGSITLKLCLGNNPTHEEIVFSNNSLQNMSLYPSFEMNTFSCQFEFIP